VGNNIDQAENKLMLSNRGYMITAEQVRKYIAPDMPMDELFMFMALCKEVGLKPWLKEVYPIPYMNKQTGKTRWQVVIAYTWYLKKASETGKIEYMKEDWDKEHPLNQCEWASVTIKRKDRSQPETHFVFAEEEIDEAKARNPMWIRRRRPMLIKTAYAQAVRKFVPELMSGGIYTDVEMGIDIPDGQVAMPMDATIIDISEGFAENVSDPLETDIETELGDGATNTQQEDTEKNAQAKVQAKHEALDAIADNIAKCDTIEKLNKLYSQGKLDKSELKADIEALLNERRDQLKIVKLSELTGIIHTDIREYANDTVLDSILVSDVLSGNKEAIQQFGLNVNAFVRAKSESVDEAETTDRDSEIDLGAEQSEDLI